MSLSNILDNTKGNNVHMMGIPEREEREQGIESLFEEIMANNFFNLVKEKNTQVQEVQRTLNKLDPKRPTPRHIIIKMSKLKVKEKILKATREKQVVTYKGTPVRLASDFSTETLQAKREQREIFKMMKRTYNQGYSTQQGYHLKSKEK